MWIGKKKKFKEPMDACVSVKGKISAEHKYHKIVVTKGHYSTWLVIKLCEWEGMRAQFNNKRDALEYAELQAKDIGMHVEEVEEGKGLVP